MKKYIYAFGLTLFVSGLQAQISTFPWNDNLETENNCFGSCTNTCNLSGTGFNNVVGDNADWTIDNFGTSSSPTGPTANGGADHNPGTSGGKYAYIESSFPCSNGNPTANFVSPFFNFTAVATPGLTFWYHMYGSSMGTMHVDVEIGGVWQLDIIPSWTANVDAWQEQIVSMNMLGGLNNVRFRIRGVVGNGFWSDMAIDDFSVYNAVYQIVPVSVVNPFCVGETTGSIQVNGLFGTPPFTYAWSNGATGSTIAGLAQGTYCVTMTDANLDTVSSCIVLNDPDSIFVNTTLITPQICSYDITQANAVGSGGTPLSGYSIDTTSANYNPDTSQVGTVVSLSGYQMSNPLEVGFDFVFFGDTHSQFRIFSDGFISFAGNTFGGGPQLLPNGSNPNNLIALSWEDLEPQNGGTISYYTTGNAPFRVLHVNFTDIPYWLGSVGDVTVQAKLYETSNCIEIHTTNSGGVPGAGNQTQGIENQNGTEAFVYPGRNQQTWTASNDFISFCPIDSTGLLYTWSSGNIGASVYGLPAGTYTVTASDALGCEQTDVFTIDPAPSNLALNPTVSDISCFGFNDGMITTNQTGGVSPINYTWNTGQSTANISNLSEGVFDIVAEDALGCMDSVIGMVIAEPDLLLSSIFELEQTTCPEDEEGQISIVVSGGVSPYSIVWNNGQIGQTASNLTAGNYQAVITDASGCESFQSATILAQFNSPQVNLGANIKQTTGAAATLNAGPQAGYLWSTGATSQTVQVSATGNYWVEVYNGNGCAASDSIYVEIWPTGINDINQNAKLSLFPNPTSSNLMLSLEGMANVSDVTVRVLNVQGQIVMERVLNTISSSETIELDVNTLVPGMYNISIDGESFKAVKSFVKQ